MYARPHSQRQGQRSLLSRYIVQFILLCNILFIGAAARPGGTYGPGRTDQPIIFDDMKCRGFEYRLTDCLHRGVEVHDCDHNRDAGVVCLQGLCMQI